MTVKSLLKKLKIDEKAKSQIDDAIKNVEKKTSGEIAVAIAPESDSYSFYELFFGVIVGAVTFTTFILLSNQLIPVLEKQFWEMPKWFFAVFSGMISFFVIALVFILTNIPFIDRKIIPLSVKNEAVETMAESAFFRAGINKTKEASGILIYISYLEQKVRILADFGIASKIEVSVWNQIAKNLADNLKTNAIEAICEAVKECGKVLEENFPAKDENPDEISNELIILGGRKW
jgi:putative membrane protein